MFVLTTQIFVTLATEVGRGASLNDIIKLANPENF